MKPTDSELTILQVLWQNQPCTVRFINEQLNAQREAGSKIIGYTTTLKMMQLMTEKGILDRKIEGRKHTYTAVIQQSETQSVLLDDFLQSTFGGSAMKLVMQALGNHETSKEELDKIKDLINKIEGGES
ncbi:MAG: BlaI/MecI/CopY family transcriptional regulator [Saprospiraceae bacterium]